ncbi:MAG TPA: hypothetical protein DIC30_09925 [Oceanospirillales bacterium]|nr:hypothetical protein [Oceanospirillales bacterium]|tara:strand:- start:2495 stop:3088 length:594 start_codon:yes stop_codon:yes gene_type:complete
MLNNMKKALLALSILPAIAITSGCALSPQIITLDSSNTLQVTETISGRTALVRVLDERAETDSLGNRGGAAPEQALLIAQPTLKAALTEKMQGSMQAFGFGGASPLPPVKVEMVVNQFNYQCNEGNWVSDCKLDIELRLNIDNEGKVFSQPFRLNESRSVVVAPQAEYNSLWINESIDKLWQHIFTKPQVTSALGVQ